ncbi:hypothetical protein [Carboxylicivirga sp. RSCT41]|uniref:hypothetical protein n=1 Tax=Carboxylicivirga agarovorans TaxID=3417570 RepID=UPI003D333787
MKNNCLTTTSLFLLVAITCWHCQKETPLPTISTAVQNNDAHYIIEQLNKVPDNGFTDLQQLYGQALWETAYIEGHNENTRYVIPFIKDDIIQTIVCYKEPQAGDNSLQPIIIDEAYLEQAYFSDKFFSSLKFHKLKKQGYFIDDCLEEFAVNCLEAEGPIEDIKVEPEEKLKAKNYQGYNRVHVGFYLPRVSRGNTAVDLSHQRITQDLQGVLWLYNFYEGEEIFDYRKSYGNADEAFIYVSCGYHELFKDDKWLLFEYYSEIMYAVMQRFIQVLSNSYEPLGYYFPEYYNYTWYTMPNGCTDFITNDEKNDDKPKGGVGASVVSPIPDIIIDQSFEDTKAECVYDKIKNTGLMKELLKEFVGSDIYDVTYKVVPELIARNGNNAYGKIIPDGNRWTILINSHYFDKNVPVFIAKTIIHETIHAAIYQKVAAAGGLDQLDPNSFEQLFAYYNHYGTDYHHKYMARHYVPKLAKTLALLDNNKYSIDYYTAISWSGLDDSYEWKSMTQDERDDIFDKTEEFNKGEKECTW